MSDDLMCFVLPDLHYDVFKVSVRRSPRVALVGPGKALECWNPTTLAPICVSSNTLEILRNAILTVLEHTLQTELPKPRVYTVMFTGGWGGGFELYFCY